ncbi:hypothetical protein NST84_06705 [Paenibacillus sp. FSL R7-0345]|uniref:phosphotransferase-like protein n=1 Tax=Paenibacillus sp. FSL R7-0345 TaxID=2954535 RepID=UPI003159C990
MDDFDLVIEQMEDRHNNRLIPVETAYFYHRTIAMFADKGINLVLDTVIDNAFSRADFAECLAEYPLLRVGVHCPPEELARRERERGDRRIGQALEQLAFVEEVYDVEVDIFTDSVEQCTEIIVQQVMKNSDG